MIAHVPPKMIFSLDTELGALEPDSVVFDTGIVAFVLNPDNITYSYAGHFHWLNGFDHNEEGRVKSRSTMDYWLFDARSSYKPSPEAVAYMGSNKSMRDPKLELMEHSAFVLEMLEKHQVDRTNWVVCAKGPDTDCLIVNHRFAQHGFEFSYRFARFSSLRNIEPAVDVFRRAGLRENIALRDNCPIPFAPADWYSSDSHIDRAGEDHPWKGMPPCVEHVALWDAWIEGLDSVEYYTALNRLHAGQVTLTVNHPGFG